MTPCWHVQGVTVRLREAVSVHERYVIDAAHGGQVTRSPGYYGTAHLTAESAYAEALATARQYVTDAERVLAFARQTAEALEREVGG